MRHSFLRVTVLSSLSFLSVAAPAVEESQVISRLVPMEKEERMQFAVQTGLAVGNAAVSTGGTTDNRVAFTLGVAAEIPLAGKVLSLQPEVNLAPKGGNNGHFGLKGLTTLTYLEVPLLLKVKFQVRQVQPFIMAGLGVGYLISREVSAAPAEGEGAPQVRSFDATVQFGLGAALKLKEDSDSGALTVAVRYSSGLVDADAGPNSWYSQSYALLVGYQL